MILKKIQNLIVPCFIAIFLIVACKSTSFKPTNDALSNEVVKPELVLTFAGDIMAHNVNFNMKDYSEIYSDVQDYLKADHLTFGNLEIPVVDSLPMSTYPSFNVHTPYALEAVKSGFDVFSLANNHANDKGIKGIKGTRSALSALPLPVYYNGLKQEVSDTMQPIVIEKNQWRILFLSITEILNSYDTPGKLVYYVSPTEKSRSLFLQEIARMRAQYPCDLFVLSIHLGETEYVRTVSEAKKAWFEALAISGVDIVWGHHPHVMQSWETVSIEGQSGRESALFMYSMGNFISGQRYNPNYDNPSAMREYTGDAVLLRVQVTKNAVSGVARFLSTPLLITNYTHPQHGAVVRIFNTAFIEGLPEKWRTYYRQRFGLMRDYLPLLP